MNGIRRLHRGTQTPALAPFLGQSIGGNLGNLRMHEL